MSKEHELQQVIDRLRRETDELRRENDKRIEKNRVERMCKRRGHYWYLVPYEFIDGSNMFVCERCGKKEYR